MEVLNKIGKRSWDRKGEAMLSTPGTDESQSRLVSAPGMQIMDYEVDNYASGARWFAVWTRSRQEKVAASMLETLGIPHFLPLTSETRQWSDRKQKVTVPLFSGYLFVRVNLLKDNKLHVLKTPGVVGFVGNNTGPLPIPDRQIGDIRAVLNNGVEYTVYPFLEEGDRVRVVRGVLAGVEGTLVRTNSTSRLVISIEMIHKSLAVSVSRQDVEPVNRYAA
jgi:transcription termination/antitermination protein NusG